MTPGRKPSSSASARSTRSQRRARPCADLRSSATTRRPRSTRSCASRRGASGRVDAHHVRAHVGEQHGGERRRPDAGQLDDAQAGERSVPVVVTACPLGQGCDEGGHRRQHRLRLVAMRGVTAGAQHQSLRAAHAGLQAVDLRHRAILVVLTLNHRAPGSDSPQQRLDVPGGEIAGRARYRSSRRTCRRRGRGSATAARASRRRDSRGGAAAMRRRP